MVSKKEFEKEGYTLTIMSQTLTITDAIETYVLEKIDKIEDTKTPGG